MKICDVSACGQIARDVGIISIIILSLIKQRIKSERIKRSPMKSRMSMFPGFLARRTAPENNTHNV